MMISAIRSRVRRWRLLVPVMALATAASPHLQMVLAAADGDLDPTFGPAGTGKVQVDFAGNFDNANAVAVQPDGKIVVAGTTFIGGQGDFAVARLNQDGTLDPTFDGDGRVTTDSGGNQPDATLAVTLQPDGKIIVVGSSDAGGVRRFAVIRYNTDGSLDTSFNETGKVATDFGGGSIRPSTRTAS